MNDKIERNFGYLRGEIKGFSLRNVRKSIDLVSEEVDYLYHIIYKEIDDLEVVITEKISIINNLEGQVMEVDNHD